MAHKTFFFVSLFATVLAAFGCQTAPQNSNQTTTVSPAASASPAPSPSASPAAANIPVTVPMLDASLRDEAFLTKAKGSLGLTDLEIDKLHSNIDKAMSELDEGDSTDRSTKESEQEATDLVEKN